MTRLLTHGKRAVATTTRGGRAGAATPLSPLKGTSLNQQPLKKAAKKGAKLLSPTSDGRGSTTKVLGNRPILQDMMNEFVG